MSGKTKYVQLLKTRRSTSNRIVKSFISMFFLGGLYACGGGSDGDGFLGDCLQINANETLRIPTRTVALNEPSNQNIEMEHHLWMQGTDVYGYSCMKNSGTDESKKIEVQASSGKESMIHSTGLIKLNKSCEQKNFEGFKLPLPEGELIEISVRYEGQMVSYGNVSRGQLKEAQDGVKPIVNNVGMISGQLSVDGQSYVNGQKPVGVEVPIGIKPTGEYVTGPSPETQVQGEWGCIVFK